jgi:hypothetical protein
MSLSTSHRRSDRRGGILATAMLFFVMVTVAGTAILSMSSIQKLRTVRNGIDVRLMIAAEGAIETVRGRFTLVKGVQDDWTWISSATWTSLGTINVNGINVDVEALRDPSPSVPRCRVRARASASNVTRVVEITVRVASFSDYSVFASGGSLGANYKLVGNYYAAGNIDVPFTGARIYGRTELTGSITGTYGIISSPEWPFVNQNPINVTAVPFPTDISEWDYMKDIAETTGYVFAENTLEIVLNGTTFTRYYVRRRNTVAAGAGTTPTGQVNDTATSWINTVTGVVNYTNTAAANPYLVNADYEFVSQTLPIPDEGVIYIQGGPASGIATAGPTQANVGDNLAVSPRTNGFTQQFGLNSVASVTAGVGGTNYGIFANAGGFTVPAGYTDILLLSGTLDDRRLTLVCDHRIVVKQPIAYQGNLDNPDNRRFFNDGLNGKQGDTAMDMKEMLGVMSLSEIHPTPTWWNPLPAANRVTGDQTGETVPGHDWADIKNANADYCMDGVYLALNVTAPTRNYGFTSGTGPLGEMWFCGGLICQGSYGGGNGNTFYRRNYDWDYRMNITMPPYFLRAYNTTARFIPGTWRTWEE